MTASSLSFKAGVLFLIAGMIWGLQMGISQNHTELPAHAHLLLLGFVAMFLFGTFYRLNPAVEAGRLALLHVWIWIAGTIVVALGVGFVYAGHHEAEPLAAIGSIIVFCGGLIFAWLVFQARPLQRT